MSARPISQQASALRDGQRRWLSHALEHMRRVDHSATFTSMARIAGLNPNTLTRFVNDDAYNGALSTKTLAKIAEAAGYPVTSEVLGQEPGASGGFGGLREPEASHYHADDGDPLAAMVASLTAGHLHRAAWTLRGRALEGAGYMPGDILIVDLNAQPLPGDVVCAQIYEAAGGAETVFRLYEPPYLLAIGPMDAARRPLLVPAPHVLVRGVVTQTFRPRQGRQG